MKRNHHFLIHYSRVMKAVGPLALISCIRFEGKHREGKVTSHVSICRKNSCRTIVIKAQLMQNHRFMSAQGIRATLIHGPIKLVKMQDLNDVHNFLQLLLPHLK